MNDNSNEGCSGALGNGFIVFINLLCSGSYLYEMYSDLLIIWVALFSASQVWFGFIAVIFPLLNRLLQIFMIIKLIIVGVSMRKKTIPADRIDLYLISLNMLNVSRLLFPNLICTKPKILVAFTVKECILKLIQIGLKLVLLT